MPHMRVAIVQTVASDTLLHRLKNIQTCFYGMQAPENLTEGPRPVENQWASPSHSPAVANQEGRGRSPLRPSVRAIWPPAICVGGCGGAAQVKVQLEGVGCSLGDCEVLCRAEGCYIKIACQAAPALVPPAPPHPHPHSWL